MELIRREGRFSNHWTHSSPAEAVLEAAFEPERSNISVLEFLKWTGSLLQQAVSSLVSKIFDVAVRDIG